MEDNFKRLGNKYIINLNAVAYFEITTEGDVKITFQGVAADNSITIESEQARLLVQLLSKTIQLAPPAGTVTLKRPLPSGE